MNSKEPRKYKHDLFPFSYEDVAETTTTKNNGATILYSNVIFTENFYPVKKDAEFDKLELNACKPYLMAHKGCIVTMIPFSVVQDI